MRLLCNGVALDLESGATMAFKKSNPLFAFDTLTCERTQSFSLPSTPTNESVLGLAKIPAYSGEGMRRRFDAELQDGTVVKRGYLYADKYDKGRYNAIFVTGELIGLQTVKNAGKLRDFINTDVYTLWSGSRSAALTPTLYDCVAYKDNTGNPYPSVNLGMLIELAASALGVQVQNVNHNARIVPSELKPYQERERQLVSRSIRSVTTLNDVDVNALQGVLFGKQGVVVASVRAGEQIERTVVRYMAKQDMRITFPKGMVDNWFLCDLVQGEGNIYGNFIGGYSFYYDMPAGSTSGVLHREGEPLAGRTIDIADGQTFLLVNAADFKYEYDSSGRLTQGWIFEGGVSMSHAQNVMLQGVELNEGDYVFLQDNLPDCTLAELLKVYAAINGRVLNYTDAEGVTFDAVDVNTWDVQDVDDGIVSTGEVRRTFSDYAQRNVVHFDTDDAVPASKRLQAVYTIDNDNLEAEKDLQVIPFSESGETYVDGVAVAYVDNDAESGATGKPFLMAHGDNVYAVRVSVPVNNGVQTLCDASTSVSVSARMTLADFDRLTAKTVVLMRNTRYVWTDANWSKGIVQLKLSKIDM